MLAKSSGSNSWTYKYDYENRLKQATLNRVAVLQASYDGDGRRIQTISGDTTIYDYPAVSWDPAYVKDITTGTATDLVFAAGLRVGKVQGQGAAKWYYHLDRLGNVRLVTQAANVESFQTKYQPYGTLSGTSGSEMFQFTGKQYDATTGLYYYGMRYYDSQSGRFISEDMGGASSGNSQSLNRYIYALDNPNRYTDPTGADNYYPIYVAPLGAGVSGGHGGGAGNSGAAARERAAYEREVAAYEREMEILSHTRDFAHALGGTAGLSVDFTPSMSDLAHALGGTSGLSVDFTPAGPTGGLGHGLGGQAGLSAVGDPNASASESLSAGFTNFPSRNLTPIMRGGYPSGYENYNSDFSVAACEITKTGLTGPPGQSPIPGIALLSLLDLEVQTTTSPSILGTALSIELAFAEISPFLGPEAVIGIAIAICVTVGLQVVCSGYFGDPCTGPLHF